MRGAPPRIAEEILRRVLPREDRDFILGDLEQQYRTRVRGGRGALRWYWWQVSRAVTARGHDAIRGVPPSVTNFLNFLSEGLVNEVRFAVRRLLRAPGYALTSIATLSLGIGAATAVFTVVNAVLISPLPFEDPDALVAVRYSAPGMDLEDIPSSDGMYFTYQENAQAFVGFGAWSERQVTVEGNDGPERVSAVGITSTLVPVLGVRPLLGRAFSPTDDEPGATPTVLLSHSAWRTRFGGDPTVIGTTFRIDDLPHEIIGVMPTEFALPHIAPALFVPAQLDRGEASFGGFQYETVGRLSNESTFLEARADIERMIPLAVEHFFNGVSVTMLEQMGFAPTVAPLRADYVGDVATVLWVVLGAALEVLLVAFANVTNLSLARSEQRRRELAIRPAIGAGRGGLVLHSLTESTLISAAGGLIGGVFVVWMVHIVHSVAPADLPRLNEILIGPASFVVVAGTTACAALLLGVLPALGRMNPTALIQSLRAAGGSGSARENGSVKNTLAATQIAMAVVLLCGSGLLLKSFRAISEVNPGFSGGSDVLTFRVAIPETVIASDAEAALRVQEIAERIAGLAGVESVSAATSLPLSTHVVQDPLLVEDVAWTGEDVPPVYRFKWILPDYFATMRNPLLAGRGFREADVRDRSPVAIVTEDFAIAHWGSPGDALGERIAMPSSTVAADNRWHEIVGVVGTVRDRGVEQAPTPVVYWPLVMHTRPVDAGSLFVPRALTFVVRSSEPERLTAAVRASVQSVASRLPVSEVQTLERLFSRSIARTSFAALVLGISAWIALLLGVVGVYGVVSFLTGLRTKEFGVRLAIGAERHDIRRIVMRHGVALVAAGILIGLVVSAFATRLMSALLYEVQPTDPFTFISVAGLLATVGLIAAMVPAERASRADPLNSLRVE